jgi:hypothetical protein
VSPERRQLYFSVTRIGKGMTNLTQYNPVQDDISLPENKCGVIMSVDMDENWSGTKSAVSARSTHPHMCARDRRARRTLRPPTGPQQAVPRRGPDACVAVDAVRQLPA